MGRPALRGLPAVAGGHLRVVGGGDAPRWRRLRLDQPHSRRRDRLRARGLRLVVHPLALGPDLRQHPQRRGDRAAGLDHRLGRRSHLLLRGQGPVLGLGHYRDPRLDPRRGRGPDLRSGPEDLLLRRTDRARLHVRPAAGQLEDRLHLGAQQRGSRRAGRERRPLRRNPEGGCCGHEHVRQCRHPRPAQRDLPADPVHRLLQPLVELGSDPVR